MRQRRERSVFLEAMGSQAELLHPKVREYAEGPGGVEGERGVVVGEGVFRVAGSRFGRLNLIARPFVGPELLMTRYGHDVPFFVRNEQSLTPDGATKLTATRVFCFEGGEQRFVDELFVGPDRGTLTNVLGGAGRVELRLRCSATDRGELVLWSERAWLRLAGLRLRLPSFASVSVHVLHGYDERGGLQTVAARVRNPLLGTVLEYEGSFDAWPEQ